jgi:hypothetical protein
MIARAGGTPVQRILEIIHLMRSEALTQSDRLTTQTQRMPRLAYLLAASHSGSTLLALLLGAQYGACSAGELKATSLGRADAYRCSCRKLIRDCEFWQAISAAMAERGIPDFDITNAGTNFFDVESAYAKRLLAPLHRGPAWEFTRDVALSISSKWRTHRRAADRRNTALVESVLTVTGSRIVIDSSKVALRLKYLLQNPRLDIKIIRVIRDGRAVSMTYIDDWNFADASDPSLRNGGTGHKRASVRRNMEEAANEWKRSQEAAECLLATLPRSQWTEVRYEELCANPEDTLRRLNRFLGLDADNIVMDFRAQQPHVIGNGMRFDTTTSIRLDERWKTHLPPADLATFERIAGDMNRRYGYV